MRIHYYPRVTTVGKMMAFSGMFVIILCEVATAAQTAGILHESPILQRSSNHESPILQRNFSTESPTQKHTLQTDIGCPSSQIVSTEGVSTCKSNVNCVDGLLCCPTATGNVRVCRKSQADSKFLTVKCSLTV